MIGVYDYTVILTYLSLLSAGGGIVVSLTGDGHPYYGMFFLLFCGLCDAFDGKVARTKAGRTPLEINYGIQIDSLADVVAFGVLPACVGTAMMWRSPLFDHLFDSMGKPFGDILKVVLFAVLILYILAAVIRLAYFNVTEEERQKTEGGVRVFYTGLPVTSASIIFPFVLLIQYITPIDITPIYFVVTVATGFLFLSKLQIRKPKLKGILILVGIGTVEFILMIVFRLVFSR